MEQLDTQEVGGSGGAATPVSLALLDLAAELDKMKAEYEVVVGDWNVRHPEGKPSKNAAGKRNTAVVRRFAQSRGLVEPLKKRLDWGEFFFIAIILYFLWYIHLARDWDRNYFPTGDTFLTTNCGTRTNICETRFALFLLWLYVTQERTCLNEAAAINS